MRLLHVEAVLGRGEPEVMREFVDDVPKYAILSHRWRSEVSYDEMVRFMKMEEQEKEKEKITQRNGYQKIINSCLRAKDDGYKWLWIDTCCINKQSSSEESESINSMYRWYQNSQVCYAHLDDVDEDEFPTEPNYGKFANFNGWPEWFTRGWTLQEFIAPKNVKFFNKHWKFIGNKQDLTPTLEKITRIPANVLKDGLPSERRRLSIAQVMSWAADRKTTRVEDRAYSLLGLFGMNMSMRYGEGESAFQRLQLKILRVTNDHSIFAWDLKGLAPRPGSVLADNPSYFRDSHDIQKVEPGKFMDELMRCTPFIPTNESESHVLGQKFHSFTVTNGGIKLRLPVISSSSSSTTAAAAADSDDDSVSSAVVVLACRSGCGNLVTINLDCRGPMFYRSFYEIEPIRKTIPELRTIYLAYSQPDVSFKTRFWARYDLTLDDGNASTSGFNRCGSFPRQIEGNTVTFSPPKPTSTDIFVMVYANDDTRSRFAVAVGYYNEKALVYVVCDERRAAQEEVYAPWADFAKKAYDVIWDARAEVTPRSSGDPMIEHAHLPRTIWAARVHCVDHSKVTVNVDQCPGGCVVPLKPMATLNHWGRHNIQELMHSLHRLFPDERSVRFDVYRRQRIGLGDYGYSRRGHFKRIGNIFQDMKALGFDPKDSAYHPVTSSVPDDLADVMKRIREQDGHADGHRHREPDYIFSLPNNHHFILLLQTLSTRVADGRLVVKVAQYGEQADFGASAPESGNFSEDTEYFTSLCAIARPRDWLTGLARAQRKQSNNVRTHSHTGIFLCESCVQLNVYFDQRITLGDYGHSYYGKFKRIGNIFRDIQALGIDPTDTAYWPVVSAGEAMLEIWNKIRTGMLSGGKDQGRVVDKQTIRSLPNNIHFLLLLKTLFPRLTGEYIVVRVVQCGQKEEQSGSGFPTLAGDSCSTDPEVFTSLCAIASSDDCRRELSLTQSREQFHRIWELFRVLVPPRRRGGTETYHNPVVGSTSTLPRWLQVRNRSLKKVATEFFSDKFGLRHLKNFVGEITFFKRLPSTTENKSRSEAPAAAFGEGSPTCPRFEISTPRRAAALPHLSKKSQSLSSPFLSPRQYGLEKQETECDVRFISQTLSVGLLEYISTTFINAKSLAPGDQARAYIDYDRGADTYSMIEEIDVLEERHRKTKDEDEQRALEEDIAGKILWLCWCGICREVEVLLREITNAVHTIGKVTDLNEIGRTMKRARRNLTDPCDDQAHLQRAMTDAGAGISKHKLWDDSRPTRHIRGQGTTAVVDEPDIQEISRGESY